MKKSLTILLLYAFLISACREQPEPKNTSKDFAVNIMDYRKEIFPVDSVRINGKFPFLMTKDQFSQLFGKADSIITAPAVLHDNGLFSFLDLPAESGAQYYMIKNSLFVTKGDYVLPVLIDLVSTPVNLMYKNINIGRGTSGSYIKKQFPMSTRLGKGTQSDAGGYVIVEATDFDLGDQLWMFLLQGDRLAKIYLYSLPRYPLVQGLGTR
jgi:hypothetical protein